jgi:uncharacterized small protein (DUF1192 family)
LEKEVKWLQGEADRMQEIALDLETEVERLRAERDGMTEARNRFCGAINQIGQLFWGNNKDHFAPDAVVRKVEWLKNKLHDLEAYGGIPEVVQENAATQENNRALTAEVERLRAYPAAVDKVRSYYPTDLFPDDGDSKDCVGAKFARSLCDQIHEEAAEAAKEGGE